MRWASMPAHIYPGVYENRVSPLLQALFCAASLTAFPVLRAVPLPVLHGSYSQRHAIKHDSIATLPSPIPKSPTPIGISARAAR